MENIRKVFNTKWNFGAGSQEVLIKKMQTNERLFKIVHSKHGHGWTLLKEDNIIDLIENNNSFICEILSSYPKKVYFDIDCDEPDKLQLDDVIEIIQKYFGDVEIAISGSEEATKKSYHIILPNMIIKDINELIELKELVKKIQAIDCQYFDWKVYTTNRAMKCIFQSKPERAQQMIIRDNNKEHHFINSFFTGNELPLQYVKVCENTYTEEIDIKDLVVVDASIKNLVVPADFTIKDLEDSKKLLMMAPSNKTLSHSYTWKIALFCYWNGLTFDDFWNWTKMKDDSEDRKKKWIKHFETIAKQEYKMSKSSMIKILSFFYPQLNIVKKDLKALNTNSFLDSFNIPSVKIDKLLEMKHFETEHKCVIFNIGMGGGKTSMTVEYLEKTNKSFIWLTPRISLVMNTYQRFEDKKMDVYNYKKEGGKKQTDNINKYDKVMISCESLHKLENTSKFDVVIIDEIETLLCNWDSATHGDNIDNNWTKFKELINNSKKVILLDAFTTTKTINFMNDMKVNDIITYTSDAKPKQKILKQHLHLDLTVKSIINDLDAGKKLYVFYAYKSSGKKGRDSIEELKSDIIMRCKGKPKIMVYHGDMCDVKRKTLYNVQEEWEKYDMILTTSSISVGVNYEGSKFDKVYLLMSGMVNNIRDVIQSSMRIRNPNENIMDIYFFDTINKDIIDKNAKYIKTDDIVYKNLINNVFLERQSDFETTFLKFCSLTNYQCNSIRENLRIQNSKEAKECKILVPYQSLEEIDELQCQELEVEKIYKMEASMIEKFQVQKYYFDIKFRHLDEVNRAFVWNMKLDNYFKNINCDLIKKIKADNNVELLSKLDPNNMKISESTNMWIKENYAVNEAGLKCVNQKVSKLLNSKLGCEAIGISYHGKKSSYHIGEYLDTLEGLEIMIKDNKAKEKKEKEEKEKADALIAFIDDMKPVQKFKRVIYDLDYGIDFSDDEE